ncbi:uncharacterized protein LOC123032746 isoform X7 [Varanus komodoensis]|uniref:uncharacterized protein LOC123032746 isoform X7 n=1 Tax=Varanus komodoensis TaxID=61221 RepID=UPI001CF7DBB3|nr:uncharacterized protein LOC123032746 isoform X7 [Varanus komodoensis]
MELLTPSACYSSVDHFRSAPPGNAPGTITVVVPSNNATAQEEKKTYPRKNEALGAVQIIIALIHVALGIILLFSAKEFSPLAMNIYYPFWGGGLGIVYMMLSFTLLEMWTASSTLIHSDHEQNSFAEVHNHEWEVLATLQIHHLASSQRTFAALFKIDFNKVLMMLMPPTF